MGVGVGGGGGGIQVMVKRILKYLISIPHSTCYVWKKYSAYKVNVCAIVNM